MKDLDEVWNPLAIPETEMAYRALLTPARDLEGNERSYLVELLSQIARAQALQNKFMESRLTLLEAEQLLETMGEGATVAAKIRVFLERGRLYILEKTPAQARPLFSQAWALAVSAGEDYFVVDIAQMMGSVETPKAQQDWMLKAIEIAENSPQEKAKRWLGSLYASVAWKQFELRQYEKALETFRISLKHYLKFGSSKEIFLTKWATGKVLRTMKRTEEALELQEEILAELKATGATDGRLLEEVAECLHALKESERAQLYFEMAYKELSSDNWIKDNQPLKLKRLKDMGKVR